MSPEIRVGGFALSVFTFSLFLGCASAPPHNSRLDQAQLEYDAVRQDNSVMQSAPEQIQKASSELDKATTLLKKGAPASDVDHYAYMVRKHIAIAKEKAETDRIQAEIKKAGSRRDQLQLEAKQEKIARLKAQLANLKARETNRGLVLTLGSVLFGVNKATIKPGGIKNIDKLADFMKEDPHRNVMIEGYTDNTGSRDYNQTLSEKRAEAVRDALVDKSIDSQRIVTKGFGEDYPVASNKTAAGRQQNRRVEIVISDENGEFPKSR
ncbi:MAG: OmpA family protein [Nitrospiraceae bacterium]|nr:OmpA family protein [Nitrospiraceae bacterium]